MSTRHLLCPTSSVVFLCILGLDVFQGCSYHVWYSHTQIRITFYRLYQSKETLALSLFVACGHMAPVRAFDDLVTCSDRGCCGTSVRLSIEISAEDTPWKTSGEVKPSVRLAPCNGFLCFRGKGAKCG